MPTPECHRGPREDRNGAEAYPMSRKRYYITQTLYLCYAVIWLGIWYFVMKSGSGIGAVLQVLLFALFFLTQPSGVLFRPYEDAMKRMLEIRPRPSTGSGEAEEDASGKDPPSC